MFDEIDKNYKVISVKSIAKRLNDYTFTDYFYRLMMLARTMFEWEGLPEGIDEKHLEQWLFSYGRCVFFKDPNNGYMIAKCNDSGQYNYYDEPTELTPFGTNYMGNSLRNGEECILIRNNDDCVPTYPTIRLYAMRLTEIERTIDVNIKAQKTPVIVYCTDKQKQTLKLVYDKYDGNEPVIFGDKQLDANSNFEVLKTDAPIVFDKLQIHKHSVMNEVMTFLGINNANLDKRERLVDDEVQANNEQILMNANIMLKARERACELINKKYGLNIKVKLRERNDEVFDELETTHNNALKDSKGSESEVSA